MNKHDFQNRVRGVLSAALAATLTACGGGGDGGATVAGIDGTGGPRPAAIAVGAITGFGSIFVNGVEYSIGNTTTVTVNGQPGTEAALRIGQVVTVNGTLNVNGTTGTAASVSFDDNVEGPITAINLAAGTLSVLGQAVRVTATTTFDNSSISPPTLASLAVGNVVEISGYPDANGVIAATRIERKAAGGELEITGTVSNLVAPTQFNLGALIVNYAAAQLRNGSPGNGGCVEVKGLSFNATTNTLVATSVEVKSCAVSTASGNTGEIEGVVTTINSSGGGVVNFNIGAQRVVTNAQTTFENGTVASVVANVKVEAEGTFDATGVLVARKVAIKPEGNLRVVGLVQAKNATAGTVTVLGVTVTVNASTVLNDKSSQRVASFDLGDIVVGDYIEARGYAPTGAAPGSFVAALLERDNADNRQSVRGFLPVNPTQQNLALLGVSIAVNGATEYRDAADTAIGTLSQFLTQAVAAGGLVDARCRASCTPFVAERLEIELP
jgi:hypothetical protein